MSLSYPGLICDGLRPMFGAAAPAITAAIYRSVVGVPWAGGDDEGGAP